MAVRYLGQRQVEVGALNASFEPIRLRLAGKADPLTPRTQAKVRLHVPDDYLTRRGRRRSPDPQPTSERGEPKRDASKSPEVENKQDVYESCIKQAIGKAGFGSQFEQLPIDEKRNVVEHLRQGLVKQMQTIFQSRGIVSNVQSPNPAQSRETAHKTPASQSSSQPAFSDRRAATSPELQVRQHQRQQSIGQSPSKKRRQELQRQSEKEASMQANMMSRQHIVPWAVHAALASRQSEQQVAQDNATQGGGMLQPGHPPPQQHQQPQLHQQIPRPHQFQMRPMVDVSAQVKTWPELPVVKGGSLQGYEFEKGSQGKGKASYGRVNSETAMSIVSTSTAQSTQVMSMDSLPWPSENTARVSTQSMDSLPRMIVRSMDSLPHVAVNTMDSLPEIAESGSEDGCMSSSRAFSQRSLPFPQLRSNPIVARKFFAPQTRTCPDLPDYREGADSWPRASSASSLPQFEWENERGVQESVSSLEVIGAKQGAHPGLLQQTQPGHAPETWTDPADARGGSAAARLTTQTDGSPWPTGSSEARCDVFQRGPLAAAGDTSAAQVYLGPPSGSPTPSSQSGEPPPPPLPLGLLSGSMTYSL